MTKRIGRVVAAFVATLVFVGIGASGAFAAVASGEGDTVSKPTLAQTGYDFTPMLVTAAVFLLISGVTVIVAKYVLARSSHS